MKLDDKDFIKRVKSAIKFGAIWTFLLAMGIKFYGNTDVAIFYMLATIALTLALLYLDRPVSRQDN